MSYYVPIVTENWNTESWKYEYSFVSQLMKYDFRFNSIHDSLTLAFRISANIGRFDRPEEFSTNSTPAKHRISSNKEKKLITCKECGSNRIQKRGLNNNGTKQRIECQDCSSWGSVPLEESDGAYSKSEKENGVPERETNTYTESDNSIHVICDSKRIRTRQDVIEFFNIDTEVWKIKEFTVKSSEGYRKDRKVDWHVSDGTVDRGDVEDSGKMLIVPMQHTETKFVRKQPDDIWTQKNIDKLFESIKTRSLSAQKTVSLQYSKNGKALIVPIADFHLGLLATQKTNGNEYNMEIAERGFVQTIQRIKEKVKHEEFEEVIFVLGNDFLNSDNLSNTTSHGTPQDSETFWYEIIDKAIEMITYGVNSLLDISKVSIYNVVSNHDNHSMYGIMKTISAVYANNKNVSVDVSSLPRKYIKFGKNVIGLTHDMKIARGLELMTTEAKEHWSDASHFFWILAHLHKAMVYEAQGLLEIYRVPTFSGFSRWSNEKGFVQAHKKTQCFVLDEQDGIIDIHNVVIK